MTQFEHDEIQDMIDAAIEKAMARHNRNASIISACFVFVLLGFYAHAVLTLMGR